MALDNFRKVNITLNKANQRVLETQIAKVGDANGRELVVQITNNGIIEDQTGTTLKLNWQHENGNQGSTNFKVIDITTGRFSVYYPTEMLYKGKVNASIEITSNGQITNSMNFKIIVQADVFNGEAGTVDGVFISLADVNKKLDDREKEYVELKSRQTSVETQFNAIQQDITDKDVVSAPEIIAARNGEANLKARLDKEQQEVTAQLAQTKHQTINISEYTTTDYDSIFADIVSRVALNDFTTLILDSRTITINTNVIFTKRVRFVGNGCKIKSATTSKYIRFPDGVIGSDLELDGVSFVAGADNVNLTNVSVKNIDNTHMLFNNGFSFIVKKDLIYRNINLTNCHVDNVYQHGFTFRDDTATGQRAKLVENVNFANCTANACGKSPTGWSVGFLMEYVGKAKDWTFINCHANNCLESGFHCEAWVERENITFISCRATGNGLTPHKPNALYGYGFWNYPEFTFINCTSKGNKRPFSVHYHSEDNVNLIEFGTHINSVGDGEPFDYPIKDVTEFKDWLPSRCALGLNNIIYTDSQPYGYSGAVINFDGLSFSKDADGSTTVSPKTPFYKRTNTTLTTPPIPINSQDVYGVEFNFKVDERITGREKMVIYMSTLDKNFAKNNGNRGFYSNIYAPTTVGVYRKMSYKIGGAIGTDSVLDIPNDTKYIVITLQLANDDALATIPDGELLDIQRFTVKDLNVRRLQENYLKSEDDSVYRINVDNSGVLSTIKVTD